MKKRILIGIIVSVVIILAMVWLANPMDLLENIRQTNLYLILLVIILYLINLLTKAFRWYLLVNSSGAKVSFNKTFPFYVIALALNNVTPGKIGGEPVRAYLLNKEAKVPIGQGIASIFAEKIMDIIVIATMAVIGAIFILPLLPVDAARILVVVLVLVVAGIIITLYIVSHGTILEKTVDKSVNFAMRVSKHSLVKQLSLALVGFVDRFKFGMGEILKAKRNAGSCIILTVIIWINEAVRLFIILLALPNIEGLSLGAVFIASSIANILGFAVPLGAGNILGIETVFIALGMSRSSAGAASFLQVATSIWISVPLGAAALVVTGFKLSKLSNSNNKQVNVSDTNTKKTKLSVSNPNPKKVNIAKSNPKKVKFSVSNPKTTKTNISNANNRKV
ncbi:lysylphosphatidylglycerol synthase transmembrane domain-containing protein [[Eubacterium] cellulosolvens]